MKYSYFFIVLLLIVTFIGIKPVFAQFDTVGQDEINVDMSPEFPGPNQTVSISIVSYTTNLNAATITWEVNGKVLKTGKGERHFSFTTGDFGKLTTVTVTAETAEGQTIVKDLSIQPSSVDLLWQSESFVPPFYKGKPLFSYQNRITFIAMPHIASASGAEISSKNLIYKWTQNGSAIEDVSGYGKNSYTTTGSLIARPLDIEVEVSSTDSSGAGYARTIVAPTDPELLFYEKNPSYGIQFQRAISGRLDLGGRTDISILAAPYFFGTLAAPLGGLQYLWSINGNTVENGLMANVQDFKTLDGASGVARISLDIENHNKILQAGNGSFSIVFGNSE